MVQHSPAHTTREVEVSAIPSGERTILPAGIDVIITQALGGSFTIAMTAHPGLFRVEGKDADAIGQTLAPELPQVPVDGDLEKAIWDQLKTCYDPEIPVNIVDLGLIYSLDLTPTGSGHDVLVKMTLTAPGCGMGPVIASEAQQKILSLEGITNTDVELVWEPQWSPDRISPEGKQKLGME